MPKDATYFNQLGSHCFPNYLGIVIEKVEGLTLIGRMPIDPKLFAPNGFLHAGSIVSLADTIAGYATIANLPEGAKSFTTIELKSNFMRAAREGSLIAESIPVHIGRTTQVWNISVKSDLTGKQVAFFTCTQLILY